MEQAGTHCRLEKGNEPLSRDVVTVDPLFPYYTKPSECIASSV